MSRTEYPYKLILGSGSPRRKELLAQLGYEFTVRTSDMDERPPADLKGSEIAEFLAAEKSDHITVSEHELLITADTVVWNRGLSLAKPSDRNEAIAMLKALSGGAHEVITGVCLRSEIQKVTFSETTIVHFKELSDSDIAFYVDHYKPFDKAGGYGIQEWIGMIGIHKIEGSYFNVVGLPVDRLDSELQKWANQQA